MECDLLWVVPLPSKEFERNRKSSNRTVQSVSPTPAMVPWVMSAWSDAAGDDDDGSDKEYFPTVCVVCETNDYVRCCTCGKCVSCAGHPTPDNPVDTDDIFTSRCGHVCCCVQAPECCSTLDVAACKHDVVMCGRERWMPGKYCLGLTHSWCTSSCDHCSSEMLCPVCVQACDYCGKTLCSDCHVIDKYVTVVHTREDGFKYDAPLCFGKACEGEQCQSCEKWVARDSMIEWGDVRCELCDVRTCWKDGCADGCSNAACARGAVCAYCRVYEEGVGMVCRTVECARGSVYWGVVSAGLGIRAVGSATPASMGAGSGPISTLPLDVLRIIRKFAVGV